MVRDTLVDFFQDFAAQPQEFLIYDERFSQPPLHR